MIYLIFALVVIVTLYFFFDDIRWFYWFKRMHFENWIERRKKISESMKGNENANQKQIGEIFPRSESIRQDEKPKDTYIRTNQKIAEEAGTNEKAN